MLLVLPEKNQKSLLICHIKYIMIYYVKKVRKLIEKETMK